MATQIIEAGPIELQDKNSNERITLCLMHDLTLSERRYRACGDLQHEQAFPPMKDLDQGLQALMSRCQELKATGCEEKSANKPSTLAPIAVKKAPVLAPAKRTHKDVKGAKDEEEKKSAPVGVRRKTK